MQPVQIGLGTAAGNSNKLQLDFGYGPTDRNNGNVRGQTITTPGLANPFVQTYTYDPLNRLRVAEETSGGAPQWKQVYGYDQFGNRTFAAGTTLPNPLDAVNNPSISPNSNRLTSSGFGYDNAGNLLCDPGHPCTQTPFYAYNAEGQMLAEYSTQGATGGTSYLTQDHLGSTRLVTGPAPGSRAGSLTLRLACVHVERPLTPVLRIDGGVEGAPPDRHEAGIGQRPLQSLEVVCVLVLGPLPERPVHHVERGRENVPGDPQVVRLQ